MPRYSKKVWTNCCVCGFRMLWNPKSHKPPRCVPCGTQAMISNAYALHDKQGPEYDKWRAAMKAWISD